MSSQNYFKTWQLIGDEMTEGERERRPSTFGCDHDIAMTGFENDKDAMNAKEWKEMEHLPRP